MLGCTAWFVAQPLPSFAQIIDPTGQQTSAQQQRQQQGSQANGNGSQSDGYENGQGSSQVQSQSSFQAGSIGNGTQNAGQAGTLVLGLDPNGKATMTPRVKPSAKPSEFETFVAQAVGHKVIRFGTDLLLPSDRDYAVPATATIPPDYPIAVGDTVHINLTGSIEGSADFEVDNAGQIFLPNVGTVNVAGVRFRDLRSTVANAIGRKYRGYEVTVSVQKLTGLRVYVTGFANNPGAYSVNSLSTLVNAVLAAGGPNAGGSFRRVELRRGGRLVRSFDLYDLIRNGDKSHDAILQNEDVLYIPAVGKQVAVIGSVNEEAIYEALPGETLAEMLAKAGGPGQLADTSRVLLYRLTDQSSIGSRDIATSQLAAMPVEGGDMIQVLAQGNLIQPLEHQSVLVRIEGEVERPGNYYVEPNTPLSQVMQMAGGTTQRAYVYGTKLLRQSVREQQRQSYLQALDQLEQMLAAAPLNVDPALQQTNGSERLNASKQLLAELRAKEPDGRLVLGLAPDARHLDGDLLLENNDRIIIPPRVDTVGVFGAVYRPASFLRGGNEPLRVNDYIERAGGTQRYADKGRVFVVRANGDILSKKQGALNARVLPGDVIFVPIKSRSTSILSTIRDVSQIVFQFGLAAAAVTALR
jgi:polysaccharide export outer membrane protein